MEPVILALVIVVIVAVVSGLTLTVVLLFLRSASKRERERTRRLKSSATVLGWRFAEDVPLNYLPNLEYFALFREGHSKEIKNLLYGEANRVKAALFDYIYVTGTGKYQEVHYQSVVYFEPRNLSIPFFSLRPEHILHKVITAFGYQDIDFGNRPTFSSKYLLRGAEEQAIRNTFNDGLLAFYEANQGICTDGGGNQLFIFKYGYRMPPHDSQSFIDWASRLQNLFPRQF
jgi:hypothetical protein